MDKSTVTILQIIVFAAAALLVVAFLLKEDRAAHQARLRSLRKLQQELEAAQSRKGWRIFN